MSTLALALIFFFFCHVDISHLIQLKFSNNLIGNNCLEKLNYINKTILTDYV